MSSGSARSRLNCCEWIAEPVQSVVGLLDHYVNVESVPDFTAAMQRSIRLLLFVLRGQGRRTHSLGVDVDLDWLFGAWGTFQKEYEKTNGE